MPRTKGAVSKERVIAAEDLREVLKPIYQKLLKAGVAPERLPGNDTLVSKLMEWVDDKKVDEWIKKYADLMQA